MKEIDIQNTLRLELQKLRPYVRLFRNNVGTGWQGKVAHKGEQVVITHPRPLHAGLCVGSSDLIGWTTIEITPDMVGKTVPVFTAVEVKAEGGRTSAEQQNFIRVVRAAGGFAGIAHNVAEALEILDQQLPENPAK